MSTFRIEAEAMVLTGDRLESKSIDAWDLNQNLGSSGANTQTLVRWAITTGLSIQLGETIEILESEEQDSFCECRG